MAGYVRQDVSNNIANGSVVDADDLDNEFDAVAGAFSASTGHTHDGSTAEGAPITVVGPAQDVVVGSGSIAPKTDSAYELGTTTLRWSTGYLDDLVLTNALPIAQGGTGATSDSAARTALGVAIGSDVQAWSTILDNTTASYTTAEETKLAGIEALADVTDTANVTAAGALMDSEVDADIKTLSLPANTTISTYGATLVDDADATTARATLGLGSIATQDSDSVSITGGSITGITDLAVADGGTGASTAASALTNLGLTATAAELNTLDGITATVTELNYTDGVTSNIQTQLDAKAPDNELTQVQAEDDTSTVFGLVSGQRLAQGFDSQTIGFAALGTIAAGTDVKLSKDSLSSREEDTFAQLVKVGIFQSGSVRLTLEQSRGGFTGSSIVEVYKNDVLAQSWSTSSTSFVSRSLDISVSIGDDIAIQHRHSDDNINQSQVQLIRFQTTGDPIWPLFTIGIEDVSV